MFREFIASQFKKPTGLFGIFSANIMVKNNQKNYNRLIRDLDLQPQDKVLEIGYGPGIGIQMIAERCATCSIHGLDFSKLMYKRATKYNKPYIKAGRVQLLQVEGEVIHVIVQKCYDISKWLRELTPGQNKTSGVATLAFPDKSPEPIKKNSASERTEIVFPDSRNFK